MSDVEKAWAAITARWSEPVASWNDLSRHEQDGFIYAIHIMLTIISNNKVNKNTYE